MLETGAKIKVGNDKYELVQTPIGVCPCTVCAIPNCAYNEEWKEFKQNFGVTACEKLIGVRKHFRKVEDAPQVAPSK